MKRGGLFPRVNIHVTGTWLKAIRVEDAVGKRLAHDYTCIELGFKGALKKRGEIIEKSDVELLKRCGHYYVYVESGEVSELEEVHEAEAVLLLGDAVSGENVEVRAVEEGKAFLYATVNGLLLVDSERLRKINSTGVFVVVTRKTGNYVKEGDLIGVVDLIPLTVKRSFIETLMKDLEGGYPIIRVIKSKKPKIAVLVTGTEIVEGLKKDLIAPIVAEKLKQYDCELGVIVYARDDIEDITKKAELLLRDYEGVIITGGMSVDPTDYTPKAIKLLADEIVIYGIPIKPTTMSMVAYKSNKPVIGVSSGIIHYPDQNVLDVVLPWISAGVKVPRDYLLSLSEGGLMESFLKSKRSLRISDPRE